jgi:hypothetical protein
MIACYELRLSPVSLLPVLAAAQGGKKAAACVPQDEHLDDVR